MTEISITEIKLCHSVPYTKNNTLHNICVQPLITRNCQINNNI